MCGREIYGKPISIKIEGAELSVCPACAKHGKRVDKPKPKPVSSRGRAPVRTSPPPSRTFSSQKSRDTRTENQLVPDYHERIRLQRQKMKLSQKEVSIQTKISVSELQSIETGKMRPSDNLIERLEKFFKIKITEEIVTVGKKDSQKGPAFQTLGDIVVIRKKNEDEE
ncbi:TIGR00270 family protein [Candidatus Heimdallarchaeota archaeon]|nr:MAG: TIGR00270 family protein [Candidatus Heimdallarchaeota archaeon]